MIANVNIVEEIVERFMIGPAKGIERIKETMVQMWVWLNETPSIKVYFQIE